MFNLFKSRKKEAPRPPKLDWQELYTQCLNNIRYLRAHVNQLNGNLEHLKGVSVRTNRAKIERLTQTRDWMLRKLEEEQADLDRFRRNLAPIFRCRA